LSSIKRANFLKLETAKAMSFLVAKQIFVIYKTAQLFAAAPHQRPIRDCEPEDVEGRRLHHDHRQGTRLKRIFLCQ
jgi:hypothetical protein